MSCHPTKRVSGMDPRRTIDRHRQPLSRSRKHIENGSTDKRDQGPPIAMTLDVEAPQPMTLRSCAGLRSDHTSRHGGISGHVGVAGVPTPHKPSAAAPPPFNCATYRLWSSSAATNAPPSCSPCSSTSVLLPQALLDLCIAAEVFPEDLERRNVDDHRATPELRGSALTRAPPNQSTKSASSRGLGVERACRSGDADRWQPETGRCLQRRQGWAG